MDTVTGRVVFSVTPLLLNVLGRPRRDVTDFEITAVVPFGLLALPKVLVVSSFDCLSEGCVSDGYLGQCCCGCLGIMVPVSFMIFLLLVVCKSFIMRGLFKTRCGSYMCVCGVFVITAFIACVFQGPLKGVLLTIKGTG